MGTGTEHLVTMANDIAAFFAAASDAGESAKSVAAHLRRYWDPRMRKEIVHYVATGGEGLVPIARAAVELLATETPRQRSAQTLGAEPKR